MTKHEHTIPILDRDQAIEELSYIDKAGLRSEGRRLVGGLCDGVLVTELSNGVIDMDVVPTRGMGIAEVRCGDLRLGWDSPVRGPVHPAHVPLHEPSGLGWLDGFDEWFVRCGLHSNGAPEFDDHGQLVHPLHGRIANQPAHRVDVSIDPDKSQLELTGVVDEVRFHFQKLRLTSTIRMKTGETHFQIHDQVTNLSGSPATAQLLYHINFGQPLLGKGAEVVAPAKRAVPRNDHSAQKVADWNRYGVPKPGFPEEVYFLDLAGDADGRTLVVLKSPDSQRGVALRYHIQQLPCFTLWKNTTAEEDGYVTGLEPGTNFPNPRSFEEQQGRVIELAPGASTDFVLDVEIATDADAVMQLVDEVTDLCGATKIVSSPQPNWCAP